MLIKPKEQRVEVLIDVQNLYHSAKNLFSARVNFQKVMEKALDGRRLIRAFAYVVSTKTGEEKPFFEALTGMGIETRVKELKEFYGGAKKADWDVGLAIDAIKLAGKLDVIILVSGDGDFLPLLSYLQNNKGCLVEVMSFGKTTSARLIEEADDFTDLAKNKNFLINNYKRKKT